jgi:hypothetical protein
MRRYWLLFCFIAPIEFTWAADQEIFVAKGENCALRSIPKDAGRVETHAATLSIYPKTLPVAYTGCKAIWLTEENHLLSIAYFKKGHVVAAQVREPDEAPYVCNYMNNRLVPEKSSTRCPSAEVWR